MLNSMQTAFIKAAATTPRSKSVERVVRVADKVTLRDPAPSIKLSFRTAQKLKAEGVIQ